MDYVLIDGINAGSGEKFEWENLKVREVVRVKRGWILAGGLTPEKLFSRSRHGLETERRRRGVRRVRRDRRHQVEGKVRRVRFQRSSRGGEVKTSNVLPLYIYIIYICVSLSFVTRHIHTLSTIYHFHFIIIIIFRPFFFHIFFFTFHLIKKSGKNQIKNKSTTTSKVVPYHVVIN